MLFYHITNARNLPSIKKHGLIPKVGKNSKKAGEKEPAIYLFTSLAQAVDAMMNWFGDERNIQKYTAFEINLPNKTKTNHNELVSKEPIPVNAILRLCDADFINRKNAWKNFVKPTGC